MDPSSSLSRYEASALLAFATQLLERAGLSPERAHDVAEILLEGDLLGHTTHGLTLLSAYLRELEEGRIERSGEPIVLNDHGSSLTWDGRYLPGPWLVRKAIAEARNRLSRHPCSIVVIRRSHHIACLQAYLKPVTDAGFFILITCSDPSMASVIPYGGLAATHTPNPLAAGWPTRRDPILIDISSSNTTNGMARRLHDLGERLPGPWLIDARGRATDDPAVLFAEPPGAILPLGGLDLGHKGFALGLLVEALTSALAGHGRADAPKRWGASVFLMLLDPESFGGRDAFLREATYFAQICRTAPAQPARPGVRTPGEGALMRRERQLAYGVELHPTILPILTPWSQKLHVEPPAPLTTPD
jgi:LDH2 family malate/lactate/ureidoglycolate dehydrogenase